MRRLWLAGAVSFAVALSGCQTLDDLDNAVSSSYHSVKNALFATGAAENAAGRVEAAEPGSAAASASPNSSAALQSPSSTSISGKVAPAQVTDGDTIVLNGKRIRLFGIDAPEESQTCKIAEANVPCGVFAHQTLIGLLLGTTVRCDRMDIDRYGRDVSRCYADGYDVSAGMVRAGYAVAYRQYSMDYVADEDEAKRQKRGMWKGTFMMPWEWRAQRRQ